MCMSVSETKHQQDLDLWTDFVIGLAKEPGSQAHMLLTQEGGEYRLILRITNQPREGFHPMLTFALMQTKKVFSLCSWCETPSLIDWALKCVMLEIYCGGKAAAREGERNTISFVGSKWNEQVCKAAVVPEGSWARLLWMADFHEKKRKGLGGNAHTNFRLCPDSWELSLRCVCGGVNVNYKGTVPASRADVL